MIGSLNRGRLLALAAAAVAFGLILALVLASSRHVDLRGLEATLALVIGWGFIGAGLYAWWRRPGNTFGPLMTATGFLFFVSELAASNSAVVFTVSSLLGNLFIGVVIHMLLALPSGRLRSRAERALVVGIYAFTAPPSRGYLLFADPAETGCPECPRNLALIDANADLAHLIDTVINVVALVMVVVVLVILWRHWQVANGPERRAVGPVLFTGATVLVLLGLGIVAQLADDQDAAELGYYATQAAIGPLPMRSWRRWRAVA